MNIIESHPNVKISYTHQQEEAKEKALLGHEPIECSFGPVSVMGKFNMDHHGSHSWREGVAVRAYRDHYGALKEDPSFVVTGSADADAVLSIICLAGLLPKEKISTQFVHLVNQTDLHPIRELHGLHEEKQLLWFKQQRHPPSSLGFYQAIQNMIKVLDNQVSEQELNLVFEREKERICLAKNCEQKQFFPVLWVNSSVWGFDVWYQQSEVVVAYTSKGNVTIGCPDVDTAERLFGVGGLMNVFASLGTGWGGRETVGGSPRGEILTREQSIEISLKVQDFLNQTSKQISAPAIDNI